MSNKKHRLNLSVNAETIGYLHYLINKGDIVSIADFIAKITKDYIVVYGEINNIDMETIETEAAWAFEQTRRPKDKNQQESYKRTSSLMFRDLKKEKPKQPTSYDNWVAATSDEPTMDDWLKYGNRPKAKAPLETMKQRYPERYKNVTEEEYMRDDFAIGGTNRKG